MTACDNCGRTSLKPVDMGRRGMWCSMCCSLQSGIELADEELSAFRLSMAKWQVEGTPEQVVQ